MKATFQLILFVSFSLATAFAQAATKPLFEKSPEVFKIVNEKSQTPTFRVLDDTLTKRSLAMALNAAYGLTKSSQTQPYVEVKVEKVTLVPAKNKPNEIEMTVQISGHELPIEKTINRDDFISGKSIVLQMPKKTEDFNMLSLTSQGKFSMKYQKAQDILLIENASAQMEIASPLGANESESIQFKARGLRQTK